jgi:hypothetical protein
MVPTPARAVAGGGHHLVDRPPRRTGRAGQNGDMTEDAQPFTDEEAAFWRHVRWGQLPVRVSPEEWVELQETDEPPLRPDDRLDDSDWRYP